MIKMMVTMMMMDMITRVMLVMMRIVMMTVRCTDSNDKSRAKEDDQGSILRGKTGAPFGIWKSNFKIQNLKMYLISFKSFQI